jgi:hypothetical protein
MELESKFIEGTNNQYSIRNDGVVIRHWSFHSSGSISHKERIFKGYLDKRYKTVKVCINNREVILKNIIATYFNIENPYKIDVPLIHKDNNPLNCSLDNLYYRKPIQKTSIEYYHNSNGTYQKRMREDLPKHYIAALYKVKKEELPEDVYILYKQVIKLKRLLNMKN